MIDEKETNVRFLESAKDDFDIAISKKDWKWAQEVINELHEVGMELESDKLAEIFAEEHLVATNTYPN